MRVMAALQLSLLRASGPFLDATWAFLSASSATVPACLDLAPGSLPGGLLEGSYGRRRRRNVPNCQGVMYTRLLLPFLNTKMLCSIDKVLLWQNVDRVVSLVIGLYC